MSKPISEKEGFTLVELMLSTVIMIIIAIGWAKIMNMTSPYKEAQRKAAIEVAAGVLDIFFPDPKQEKWDGQEIILPREKKTGKKRIGLGYYELAKNAKDYPFVYVGDDSTRLKFPSRFLGNDSAIRYTLECKCAYDPGDRSVQEAYKPNLERSGNSWVSWGTNVNYYGSDVKSVIIVRIELFDNDNPDRSYFAAFEQLVGYGSVSKNLALVNGYTE